MKTFRVGTFVDDRGRVTAYTLWYSPDWPGCVEYDIKAATGAEAKKIAIKKRRLDESEAEFNAQLARAPKLPGDER